MLVSGSDVSRSALLPNELHRRFDDDQKRKITNSTKLVLEGRLSGWLSRDFVDVFSILCVTSQTIRAVRYAKREKISERDAEIIISKRDEADLKKYYELYGIEDYRWSSYYNLVLDTSNFSPKELALEICQQAKLIEI